MLLKILVFGVVATIILFLISALIPFFAYIAIGVATISALAFIVVMFIQFFLD